jgi:hypothetical protein
VTRFVGPRRGAAKHYVDQLFGEAVINALTGK